MTIKLQMKNKFSQQSGQKPACTEYRQLEGF